MRRFARGKLTFLVAIGLVTWSSAYSTIDLVLVVAFGHDILHRRGYILDILDIAWLGKGLTHFIFVAVYRLVGYDHSTQRLVQIVWLRNLRVSHILPLRNQSLE